jgi:hypothetical protein
MASRRVTSYCLRTNGLLGRLRGFLQEAGGEWVSVRTLAWRCRWFVDVVLAARRGRKGGNRAVTESTLDYGYREIINDSLRRAVLQGWVEKKGRGREIWYRLVDRVNSREHRRKNPMIADATGTKSGTQALEIALLRTDGGTQPRAALSETVAEEYADSGRAGVKLPPVVAFFDGESYWLADGFHRRWAHEKAGKETMPVDVRQGTLRDAILYSCKANATHGLRRNAADRERNVRTLLLDEEWGKCSDRWIAQECLVSHPFVAKVRKTLSGGNASTRDGNGGVPGGNVSTRTDRRGHEQPATKAPSALKAKVTRDGIDDLQEIVAQKALPLKAAAQVAALPQSEQQAVVEKIKAVGRCPRPWRNSSRSRATCPGTGWARRSRRTCGTSSATSCSNGRPSTWRR